MAVHVEIANASPLMAQLLAFVKTIISASTTHEFHIFSLWHSSSLSGIRSTSGGFGKDRTEPKEGEIRSFFEGRVFFVGTCELIVALSILCRFQFGIEYVFILTV